MSLTPEKEKFLEEYVAKRKHWPKQQLEAMVWQTKWSLQALPHQKEPKDQDYDTFLMLAGRGSGKTHTAAHWIGIRAWNYDHTRWLVTAPTSNDIRATCFEGDSGLINIIPASLIRDYNKSLFEITLTNGSLIQGIPASEPERYRGKQYHGAWFDELCAFDYIDEAYDGVQFTLRLRDPRIPRVQQIITTTPKPKELIVDLNEGKVGGDVYVANASSYDNRANLSETFFKQLETYDGTDMGRQEIYGEIQAAANGHTWAGYNINVGNPHAVVFVDDVLDAGDLLTAPVVTPEDEYPDGVNVEFVEFLDNGEIKMRVHERGVGETPSCGTGTCAVALAATLKKGQKLPSRWIINPPGGRLIVDIDGHSNATLIGPAVIGVDHDVSKYL